MNNTNLTNINPGNLTVEGNEISPEVVGTSDIMEGRITQQMDTTTFVDDRNTRMPAMVDTYATLSRQLTDLNDVVMVEQDIKDFLAKPIVFKSGNFSSSDTVFTSPTRNCSVILPDAAFSSTQGALWKNKLKGYFGARFNMRIKVVVNATRFQQGRYMLMWLPFAGGLVDSNRWVMLEQLHMSSLCQRTQIRLVDIDISSDTSVEVVIPFVNTQAFWPLNKIPAADTTTASLGAFYLMPYVSLTAASGPTTAGYTCYISLEDVELFGAASAQSRTERNTNLGPVSGPATAVSRAAKELQAIPLLGSVAQTVEWVADRTAKVAKIFGFSKPETTDSVIKVQQRANPHHSTVDGDSPSISMGLSNINKVVALPGAGGSSLDEMDFSFVCSKPAYFIQYDWTTGRNAGDVLLTIPVTPYKSQAVTDVNTNTSYAYPPVSYIAKMFETWRGSIQFTFKIAKTEFHSGRIEIAFFPTDEIAADTTNSAYVNRTIVDIRESNQFTLTVPYISRFAYSNRTTTIGALVITVLDPLQAPSTVSSTITTVMEINGGEDMEFAIPTYQFNSSIVLASVQSGVAEKNFSTTIGNSTVRYHDTTLASVSIGEKVSSLRTLSRRHTLMQFYDVESGSIQNLGYSELRLIPDALPVTGVITGGIGSTPVSDCFTLITACYAISRGSIRWRAQFDMISPYNNIDIHAYSLPRYSSAPNGKMLFGYSALAGYADQTTAEVLQCSTFNNVLDITVPQYTATYGRCVADCLTAQSTATNTGHLGTSSTTNMNVLMTINKTQTSWWTANAAAGNYFLRLYRSGGDDYNCQCFISTPCLNDNFFGQVAGENLIPYTFA